MIHLPEVLRSILEQQWQEHLSSFPECARVFHRQWKPIKNFRKAWTEACKNAGLAGKIPHDFRRTAVRNLVRTGVPERVAIMMITGHKTRSVFDRYNIVSATDLQEAARRIDQAALSSASEQPAQKPLSSLDSYPFSYPPSVSRQSSLGKDM